MVDERSKEDCCGCRACEQACPKLAIKMVEDEKGFYYPQIDDNLCNRCGICDRVCGFDENYQGFGDNPSVYAVKNKDEGVRSSSTSGGMFVAISDYILDQGGVVYGAGYKDRLVVCHKRATTKQQRDEFKGSKYVQSDIGTTFVQVNKDIENNLKVLFTGTPCQVVALKTFLKKDYDNLLTVDFICHGTPSNKIWQDFLDFIEKRLKNKIIRAEFRNKERSWHMPKTKLYFEREITGKIRGEQSYFQLFHPNYMLRPCCYNCKFANFNRAGEITIADFWGIERSMPDYDDDKGISLVLIASEKGRNVFEKISPNLEIRESCKANCLQGQLQTKPQRNKKVDDFWDIYLNKGIEKAMIRYTEYGIVRTFFKKVCLKLRYNYVPYFINIISRINTKHG